VALSTDDIVFEEVAYREPQRARRPDRDRRWACLAVEVPGPEDLPIFLDRKPADAIERHALRDTSVELGGILLGKECVDDQTGAPFVWITEALEAKHYENTQASFTYTHDSWQEITRERDRLHPDLDIVGWYHTHPDFGIFLSGHDLFIHQNFFNQPLQVAYVVDPIRQTRGFFQWRDGGAAPVGGFVLTADRRERIALSRLANDLENLPNADGGGGLLSPRLEAELFAMLTRPHTAAPADRTQAAAVFSLLGLVGGVLGLSLVLGLLALNHQVQGQAEALKQLSADLKGREDDHRSDLESAQVAARAAALDALLGAVRVGDPPERFVARYEQAVRERDEARHDLARLTVEKEAVDDHSLKLKADSRQKGANLTAATEQLKTLVEDTQKERDRTEALITELHDQIAAQKELLQESRAGVLARNYTRAWYAAAAGAIVSAVLGLLLLVTIGRGAPEEDAGEIPPSPKPAGDEPPHQIP
jgi:proteasome lid subunit RPN8/RPN11